MFGIVFDALFYIKLAAIAAVLVAVGYMGYKVGHAPYVELKAEIATAAAKRTVENEARKKEDEIKYKGLKNELDAKTLLLKRYYSANSMQYNSSGSSVLPTKGSSTGAYGAPSYEILIGQCAETTLKYTLLQDYVRELNLPK